MHLDSLLRLEGQFPLIQSLLTEILLFVEVQTWYFSEVMPHIQFLHKMIMLIHIYIWKVLSQSRTSSTTVNAQI